MEFFMFVLGILIPSLTIAYCHRQTQRRLERTDVNLLQHNLHMRMIEHAHEARVLALPSPKASDER